MSEKMNWQSVEALLEELILFHQKQLLKSARRIIPHVTSDDLLQPNDFPELENNPYIRYEEGMLAGIQTVQMAIWALKKTNG